MNHSASFYSTMDDVAWAITASSQEPEVLPWTGVRARRDSRTRNMWQHVQAVIASCVCFLRIPHARGFSKGSVCGCVFSYGSKITHLFFREEADPVRPPSLFFPAKNRKLHPPFNTVVQYLTFFTWSDAKTHHWVVGDFDNHELVNSAS